MITTPVPGLEPLPAPGEDALHPHAVRLRADRPADPRALLDSFGRIFAGNDQDSVALLVGTSGSTGIPKHTALSARALRASAEATEGFFKSAGSEASQWLLALPAHYVAGAQVLARSVLAGTEPVIARSVTEPVHFSPDVFLRAVEQLSSTRRFVSLVPTQLHKLLETARNQPRTGEEIHAALRSFTGILLGGAPASADLLAAAQELGLNVVTTYGSAETAGGCVYSGSVLPGVRVELVPEEGMLSVPSAGTELTNEDPAHEDLPQVGRIWISGAHLAQGYLGDPGRTAEHFFAAADGTRWYRTDDYGLLSTHAPGEPCILRVLGRSDDIIITGGVKISARAVAEALESHPAVREALVCGLPDARWGSAVTAALTLVSPAEGAATALAENAELREALRSLCIERLGVAAAPKLLSILPDFPLTSTGKPDRREIYSILDRDYREASRG